MRNLKIFLLVLGLGLMIGCTSDNVEYVTPDPNIESSVIEPELGMQSNAYESYESLMKLFANQTRTVDDNDKRNLYPDYYGGAFVNADDQLVVLISSSETNTQSVEQIKTRLINNVLYQSCKYSYNQLNEVIERLKQSTINTSFLFDNVGMFGIDDEHNCVRVYLYNNTPAVVNEFKHVVLDTPMIEFSECTPIINNSLSCADSIGTIKGDGGHRASVGYRAKDNQGNCGIVTAGHFIGTGGNLCDPVTFATIGECLSSRNNDGLIDAAFCKITSSQYAPTNKIAYTANPNIDTLSVDLAQPPQNLYVNMVGMRSGRKSGKVYIASMNVLDNNNHTILTDVILAEYSTQEGDSGGIVYALTSSINKRSTVGINKGSTVINGKSYGVCIKAYLINQTLGLTRY
ncbi:MULTISPECIES: hypothetical protein [Bacteroidaceae]|uniref:hypothetical protein n=1 Tax=Bacteroidaceae TaxID=815 RepID=UPI00189848C6|nr:MULTISPECIES: hypothetical protein [Bacteroidaceae]MDC2663193.1 hypothetical protein [Bacteroides ovatus]